MSEDQKMENTRVVVRNKPVLVVEGKNTFISTRCWNDNAIMEYLRAHPGKWHDLGSIAKIAYGQNIQRNRDRVRLHIPALFRYMLFQHGIFLVVEYVPPHNSARAIKLLDPSSPLECQHAVQKLGKMRKRKELSDDMYERAIAAIGA